MYKQRRLAGVSVLMLSRVVMSLSNVGSLIFSSKDSSEDGAPAFGRRAGLGLL
jgi:hypothetical protein